MGKCIFCDKSAGLFSSKHKECEQRFNDGKALIISTTVNLLTAENNQDLDLFKAKVCEIAESSFIDNNLKRDLISEGFDQSIEKILDDGMLSETEESTIVKFKKGLEFEQDDLNKKGSYNRIVQASILRTIFSGKIPDDVVQIKGTIPFNFFKDEKLIWYYNNAFYYELKTKTHYEGRSSGVSLRVMPGVYYKVGQFKGTPVQTSEMMLISVGVLALTSQNIYFSSTVKNLRIPYNKILTLQSYSDGIGIQEDKANAKPKAFGNIDGWFVYNLLANLSAR